MSVILNEGRDWGRLGSEESLITKEDWIIKVEILRSQAPSE